VRSIKVLIKLVLLTALFTFPLTSYAEVTFDYLMSFVLQKDQAVLRLPVDYRPEVCSPEVALIPEEERTVVDVEVTAYNAVPEQTNNDPKNTSVMVRTEHGDRVILALSRDLLTRHSHLEEALPYGTLVRFKVVHNPPDDDSTVSEISNQIFVVADTMNSRITRTADILLNSKSEALEWGRRQVQLEVIAYDNIECYRGERSQRLLALKRSPLATEMARN
jgi:3D (Asp-Asp-Asp) domain-containing protein